jgi:hypothetical protein
MEKLACSGTIRSVQPRIRLTRSFDESYHSYLGYAVRIEGIIAEEHRTFTIGIGKAAQAKLQPKPGDIISALCLPVEDPERDPVEYFKISQLTVHEHAKENAIGPPWKMVPPELDTYRQRGHRRLATLTYDRTCCECTWAAKMAVEIIIDNWNPHSRMKYRSETFCYGPLDCPLYKAGAKRQVEGRNKMVYVEEDWIDEQNTSQRSLEE